MKQALFTLILLLSATNIVIAGDLDGMKTSGTGFVVSRQGHILTNHHVVAECTSIRVTTNGHKKELTVVGTDEENDLAVLQLAGPMPRVARFREGRNIRPGDSVVVVGFPLHGLLASEATVTTGTVSALAGIRNDTRVLQMTAPIQPGNSGGPLLDQSGQIVGVVVSKLDALKLAKATGIIPENINFAINVAVAKSFLDSHGVEYETGPSSKKVEPAEIGAAAKKFTFLLECYPQTLDAEHRALDADRRAVEAERRAAKEEQLRALAEARRIDQQAREQALRLEQEEGARIAREKAQLKEEAERQAAEQQRGKKQAEKEALLVAEAASERVRRFPEEERAREAKKEAERQALNTEPQFREEARRKGQEARLRALRLEPEEPARIAKKKAQQEVKVPALKTPETTLRISGTAGSSSYWALVQSRISREWQPPPIDMAGQTYTMIVKFRLQRDGTIKDVVVQQSSGNAYYDMAGQRAVQQSRFLPGFPADITDSYKDVEIVFRVGESPG